MAEFFDSLVATPVLCIRFVQYLIAFCSRLEAASDVIFGTFEGPAVPDKRVKFCDPCLNHSGEIQPKAVFQTSITADRNVIPVRLETMPAWVSMHKPCLNYYSLVGPTRFTHFCAVFNCILQPTGSSK